MAISGSGGLVFLRPGQRRCSVSSAGTRNVGLADRGDRRQATRDPDWSRHCRCRRSSSAAPAPCARVDCRWNHCHHWIQRGLVLLRGLTASGAAPRRNQHGRTRKSVSRAAGGNIREDTACGQVRAEPALINSDQRQVLPAHQGCRQHPDSRPRVRCSSTG